MSVSRRALIFTVFAAALATPLSAESPLRGPIILTISGNVANPSRGAVGDADKFFLYNDVEFNEAAQFDYAALQGIGMITIKADFPMGGEVHEYQGPLLADVLAASGATGSTVTVKALDGYQVDLDLAEAVANGAVIALKRNGEPFSLGDYGPTHLVFPRAERADLAEMNDDNWIYSIYYIHVE
ncbi:MAG: molybdopterin-dependent oxidoreductase [Rhodobacteraceae bacterium]|nr:molybdopterin-dependent oxidoreductase [Paracoccaceae bacterium]